jgi:hypothetical protein
LAKRIRSDLARAFGEEYSLGVEILRRVRQRLTASGVSPARRQAVFKQLAASPLCRYLRDGRTNDVDRLLGEIVGAEITVASLGLEVGQVEKT